MKYKATKKFNELGRERNHQGLDRPVFDALKDGKTVECKPPQRLIDDGYLEVVKSNKGK